MNIHQANYAIQQKNLVSGNYKSSSFSNVKRLSLENIRVLRQQFEQGTSPLSTVIGDEQHQTMLFAMYETFNNSADLKTIKGTVNILIKLIIAVSETDKATSPFANFVRTLEVTPPGAAAIIITPMANSNGVFKIFINKKAIIGRTIS